jgi:DNA-binding XRE family transcriptional regulator
MSSNLDDAFKDNLINILTDELKVLRAKAEISQQELAEKIGVSRQTYGVIESKKQKMTWNTFLSLLFLFEKNEGTAKIVHQIGAYPPELETYLKMNNEE